MTPLLAIYQLAIPQIGRDRRLRVCATFRVARIPTSIVATFHPAPLVDAIAVDHKRGRPSRRPEGVPPSIWAQWLRNVTVRGHEDSLDAFASWMARRQYTVPAARLRQGWTARREPLREPEVQWITVIHRKDLTPELEQEWRRKISRARSGAPVYRIHLRGIQRREVR